MSTIVFSDQSRIFSLSCSRPTLCTMEKTKTTPRGSSVQPMTAAAKQPDKMQKFLTDIDMALSNFDDQISTMDNNIQEAAYANFSTAYQEAFAMIWPKIADASIATVLKSIKDTQLQEFHCINHLLMPQEGQPTLMKESPAVPTLDNILGSLVSWLPKQPIPDKETCNLISTTFSELAEAHKHYANAATGLADITSLISPEQLTLVLSTAVPPTLQLVLPATQVSPLSAAPPPPTSATTPAGKQEIVNYCKSMILPDPEADCLKKYEKHTPTQVLTAAVFYYLEKHIFDDSTP